MRTQCAGPATGALLCVSSLALDGFVVTGLRLRGWLQQHRNTSCPVHRTGQTPVVTDSGMQNTKVHRSPELIIWVLMRIRHLLAPRERLRAACHVGGVEILWVRVPSREDWCDCARPWLELV